LRDISSLEAERWAWYWEEIANLLGDEDAKQPKEFLGELEMRRWIICGRYFALDISMF
jgi:hypothetical protein